MKNKRIIVLAEGLMLQGRFLWRWWDIKFIQEWNKFEAKRKASTLAVSLNIPVSRIIFRLIFITVLFTSCQKEKYSPGEYRADQKVTFKPGKERAGVRPPMVIFNVVSRTPTEIKYTAHDSNGQLVGYLSEFEIRKY